MQKWLTQRIGQEKYHMSLEIIVSEIRKFLKNDGDCQKSQEFEKDLIGSIWASLNIKVNNANNGL